MDKRYLLMFVVGLCLSGSGPVEGFPATHWSQSGRDAANSRSQPAEVLLGPNNVHLLTVKWVFAAGGDISATPTVSGDAVFFPDWAGNLFAVNKHTGQLIWAHKISDYNAFAGSISRTSAVIHGDEVILGDIETRIPSREDANIIAVDRKTGACVGSPAWTAISPPRSPAPR